MAGGEAGEAQGDPGAAGGAVRPDTEEAPRPDPPDAEAPRYREALLHGPDVDRRRGPNRTALRAAGPGGRFEFIAMVEPGGIEPPCRDSQQVASTRVVTLLISAS